RRDHSALHGQGERAATDAYVLVVVSVAVAFRIAVAVRVPVPGAVRALDLDRRVLNDGFLYVECVRAVGDDGECSDSCGEALLGCPDCKGECEWCRALGTRRVAACDGERRQCENRDSRFAVYHVLLPC